MANIDHVRVICKDEERYRPWILVEGTLEDWNFWRADNPGIVPDLSDRWFANGTTLDVYFSSGHFQPGFPGFAGDLLVEGIDFRNANLRGVGFSEVTIRAASFKGADLEGASFHRAVLEHVSFSGANLTSVRFGATEFKSVDFEAVEGLEHAEHSSPSRISLETLRLSRGQLPETFLKGCGLSDWEIKAAKLFNPRLSNIDVADLTSEIAVVRSEKPIAGLQVFLSHSHLDKDFVQVLDERLQEDGIRCWTDDKDLVAGRLDKQIQSALTLNPLVVVVLSEDSIASDWVEWEVSEARKLEKKLSRYLLCPVALDESWKTCDWPGPLRRGIEQYRILDFSKWRKPEHFETEYRKLTAGLSLFYAPQE